MGKDTAEAGSVILNVGEVRQILPDEEKSECQNRTVWLTTSQMGWPIHAEEDEVVSSTDIEEKRSTKRFIAPMISKFIRDRWIDGGEAVSQTSALRQARLFVQEWGEARDGVDVITREAKESNKSLEAHTTYESTSMPKQLGI